MPEPGASYYKSMCPMLQQLLLYSYLSEGFRWQQLDWYCLEGYQQPPELQQHVEEVYTRQELGTVS